MSFIDKAYISVKEALKDKRYIHTLGVVSVAKKLASIYGVDEEKAELAALCHDIAKYIPRDEMKNLMKENNIVLSEDEEDTFELWHSIIAPIVVKQKIGIDDIDVLNAMRWHTTGREDMTTLEKIIFISDMIEPSRVYNGVEEIREATLKNLDQGVLMGLNHTIAYLLQQDSLVEINTIKARNYLIKNRG